MFAAYCDEMVKISERKKLEKGQLKRFLKALGGVGVGSLAGVGAGHLIGRGVSEHVSMLSPAQRAVFARRMPFALGAAGGLLTILQGVKGRKLRKYVEQS